MAGQSWAWNGKFYLLWNFDFCQKQGFWPIILLPDMLESQSRALKMWILAKSEKKLEPKIWLIGLNYKDKFAKNSKTCPHCDVTFRKPLIEKEKKFLTCSLKLAESVKGLNSSLAQSAGDLWLCKLLKNYKKVAHTGLKGLVGKCIPSIITLCQHLCVAILDYIH